MNMDGAVRLGLMVIEGIAFGIWQGSIAAGVTASIAILVIYQAIYRD